MVFLIDPQFNWGFYNAFSANNNERGRAPPRPSPLIIALFELFFQILGKILTYAALILTVVSLIDYIVKNKDVLKEQN